MEAKQTTLSMPWQVRGRGLHSGMDCVLTMKPAEPNTGIVFVRGDLPGKPRVAASSENVVATERGTVVQKGAASAATVEHLLAAFYGMGVDNVEVELLGPEVPIADGSALVYVQAIESAGIISFGTPRNSFYSIEQEFNFSDGKRSVRATPCREFILHFRIDYQHPQLGVQEASLTMTPESFRQWIAPARTFCFDFEIDAMRQAGLVKGGDLLCALVISSNGLINPPLRFPDEYVRHKMLDFIGDLSLLGCPVQAEFFVEKSGHTFNVKSVRELQNLKKTNSSRVRSA